MTSARGALSRCTLLFMVVAAMAGQTRSARDLMGLLRQGGYVLVMRHASSPREVPTEEQASPDNLELERQLDESGRRGAAAMGDALRRLQIPIGTVLTSPTYRAMETVRVARLDQPQPVIELDDGGQSMQGVSDAQASWLRGRVSETPRSGNTILVTHQPNLSRAFPDWGSSVADGETVVLRPDARGGAAVNRADSDRRVAASPIAKLRRGTVPASSQNPASSANSSQNARLRKFLK